MKRLLFVEPEADGVLLRRRIEQLYDPASYLGDVNVAERSRPVTPLNVGNPQKGGKYPQYFIQLHDHIADQSAVLIELELLTICFLQPASYSGQRRP